MLINICSPLMPGRGKKKRDQIKWSHTQEHFYWPSYTEQAQVTYYDK